MGSQPMASPSQSDFVGLDRADIFSLGATAYELARGQLLPSSGDEYQSLRAGKMTLLPALSAGTHTYFRPRHRHA
jgi:wee1-like protein kinase